MHSKKFISIISCFLFILVETSEAQKSHQLKSVSTFENVLKLNKIINLPQSRETLIGIIRDCTVDDQGNIWILDSKECNIKKYDKNGNFLIQIGRKGEGPGEFIYPFGLFVDKDKIYVTDPGLRRLSVFQKNGLFEYSFNIKDGRSVKLTKDGNIIIAAPLLKSEKGGFCIHVYNKKGKFLRSFYPIADISLKHNLISDGAYFDLDSRNNIYCVQETDYNIHKYNIAGDLIKTFSKKNSYYVPLPSKPFREFYLRSVADAWIKSWTHIIQIEILNNGLLIINLLTYKPKEFTIDIYDIDGNFIVGGLETDYRLLCGDKNSNLYFLKEDIGAKEIYKILRFSIKKYSE